MSSVAIFSDLSPRGSYFPQKTPLFFGCGLFGEAITFRCKFPKLA
jgi:hypothetical protein